MSWDDDLLSLNLDPRKSLPFPIEVISHIMRYLPYEDLCKWKEIPELVSYYNNVHCWALKSLFEYGVSIQRFKETKYPPSERYLQILSRYDCVKESERYIPISLCLTRSAENGNLDLVRYFYSQSHVQSDKDIHREALLRATERGHYPVVADLLTLWCERFNGHLGYDILLSEKAGKSGNRKLVKLLKNTYPYQQSGGIYHAMSGFRGALQTGDPDFINYCLIQVKRLTTYKSLDEIFEYHPYHIRDAIIGGDPNVIEKAIPNGYNGCGLEGAFMANDLKWIAFFQQRGAQVGHYHIAIAIEYGYLNLVQEYLTSVEFDINNLLAIAIQHRQNDIVRYLMTEHPYNVNLESAIKTAIKHDNWDAFEYLVSITEDAYIPKYNGEFREMVEYLEMRRSKSAP